MDKKKKELTPEEMRQILKDAVGFASNSTQNKIERVQPGYKVDISQPPMIPKTKLESLGTKISNLFGGSPKVDQYGKGFYSKDNENLKPNPLRVVPDESYISKKKIKKK